MNRIFTDKDLSVLQKQLVNLRGVATAALDFIKLDSGGTGESINWGDLHIAEVRYIYDETGGEILSVVIGEAHPACPIFHEAVRRELKDRGFPGVEVLTEW